MSQNPLASIFEIPGGNNRITPIEGMRGFAVSLVFLVHHHSLFGESLAPSTLLFRLSNFGHGIGNSGVDLFFVLSGFLIYGHLFEKAPGYFGYLRKRIRRIYPAFFCVFCAYLIVSLWIPEVSKLPRQPFNAAVYIVQNLLFLPGIFSIEPMITVAWSLSYEFFFYLAVPILIGITGMRRWKRTSRVWFFLGILAALCVAGQLGVVIHLRMGFFIAGMIVYEASKSEGVLKLSSGGELLAIGTYVAAFAFLGLFDRHLPNPAYLYWTMILIPGLFGLALYCVSFHGFLQWFFSATPLRWLGNMSYSFFLAHGLIMKGVAFAASLLHLPMGSPAIFVMLLILNVVLTLAGALVLFVLVEKPYSLVPDRARTNPRLSALPTNPATVAAEPSTTD